jgi:hypothetical protein
MGIDRIGPQAHPAGGLPRPRGRRAVFRGGIIVVAALAATGAVRPPVAGADVPAAAVRLAAAGAGPQADLAAIADEVAALPAPAVMASLDALAAATPAGANWLRSGLDRAAERLGGDLPAAHLAAYVADVSRPPRGRVLASSWLRARDAAAAERLLDDLLDDPALDLRREAVEKLLASADGLDPEASLGVHRRALAAARDVDQVEQIVAALADRGDKRDVARVLGFVRGWKVSGEFDNRDGVGFGRAYAPEAALPTPPDTSSWKAVVSTDRHGTIDLNAAVATKKGVLAYALAEVEMPASGLAEVRIGSPCAVAVWVNGLPVMAHEIYHASEAIDQYVAPAEFRAGSNTILVKCCQNEQTQAWAEAWKFQLRVCDPLGTPLATQFVEESGK